MFDQQHSSASVRHHHFERGFTLIEMMVVVAIIAILSAIAWPSYLKHMAKTNRVAAQGCLSEYANYMERYYTSNLRYDQTPAGVANADPHLDCQSQIARNYTLAPASTSTSFTITATPTTVQLNRDAVCGTLTLNHRGARTPGVAGCW
ncbi:MULTISPECIES: type IV pilin protein [unclassified Dyella]|uniref:type IV pilin protein n=1 Tax=unclassified Dyella TaxID=2634549 RepID=UPI003F8EE7AF